MERELCAHRQIVGIYSGTAVGALVAIGLLGLRHISPISGNQETPCAGESRQEASLVSIILLPQILTREDMPFCNDKNSFFMIALQGLNHSGRQPRQKLQHRIHLPNHRMKAFAV